MPIPTAKEYGAMQAAAHGKGRIGIPPAVAQEMIAKTPSEQRSEFARANAKRRKLRRVHRRS